MTVRRFRHQPDSCRRRGNCRVDLAAALRLKQRLQVHHLRAGGRVGQQPVVRPMDEEGDADVDAVRRRVAVLAEAVSLLPDPNLFAVDQSDLTYHRVLNKKESKISLFCNSKN